MLNNGIAKSDKVINGEKIEEKFFIFIDDFFRFFEMIDYQTRDYISQILEIKEDIGIYFVVTSTIENVNMNIKNDDYKEIIGRLFNDQFSICIDKNVYSCDFYDIDSLEENENFDDEYINGYLILNKNATYIKSSIKQLGGAVK